ncbi:hypothetical protein SAMN04488115_104155 [Bosea lathyri]|uniref:Uncharacterized protein n=2 Tax=Bosea lathyri TaxID=1036778 RepID=A0A1H5Z037_9HYPH|nr:hypothetical protein SAMN04488115_104155 [Bosea lathyri]
MRASTTSGGTMTDAGFMIDVIGGVITATAFSPPWTSPATCEDFMATGYYILSGVGVAAGDTVLTATHLAAPGGAAEPLNFAQLIGGEGAEGTPAGFMLIGPAGQTAIARHTVDNHTIALGAPWTGADIAAGACLLVLGINALPIGRLATLITQLSVSRPMLAANRLIEFAGDPEAQAAVRANLAISAANTLFTPAGGISALTVQAALVELDGEKAAAASVTAVADQVDIISDQVAIISGQVDTVAGQVAALSDDVDAVADVANGAASGLAALDSATADALAKRLRVDAVQGFTTPEKLQARQNLGIGNAVAGITDMQPIRDLVTEQRRIAEATERGVEVQERIADELGTLRQIFAEDAEERQDYRQWRKGFEAGQQQPQPVRRRRQE